MLGPLTEVITSGKLYTPHISCDASIAVAEKSLEYMVLMSTGDKYQLHRSTFAFLLLQNPYTDPVNT